MNKLLKSLLLLAGFFSFFPAEGQIPFDRAALQQRYPNEDAIYLSTKEHVTIRMKNGQPDISNHISSEMAFLNDKAHMYAEKTVSYYDAFQDIADMKAYTYVPEGNKYTRLTIDKVETRKRVSQGVFYDDYKEKYFIYPGLQAGAVATLDYTHLIKDPHFLSAFYFHSYLPVLDAEYSITFPQEVKIDYLLMGDTAGIVFSKKISGNKTTYTWKGKEIRYIRSESDAPSLSYYAGQLIIYIKEYTAGDQTIPVFSDPAKLYNWYSTLVADVDKVPDPALKHLADSLTAGITDIREKSKLIYYWVQDHIKYIAFEDGLGGFVPREAAAVYARKYGDCKDMANLIVRLHNLSGIPCYRAWIGTRDKPYSYYQVATPIVDNHMIAAAYLDKEWVFLDGTASFITYGFPSPFIQGKEAMIGLKPDSFIIAKVPVVEKERNFRDDSLFFHIDGNLLKADGKTTMGGFWKESFVSKFFYVSRNKRIEEMRKDFIQGNNKCRVDTLSYEGFENKDALLNCRFKFTIPDYLKIMGDHIYVNLNTDRSFTDAKLDTVLKKLDREERFKFIASQTVVLRIPEGYTAGALPADTRFDHEGFGFNLHYKKEGDRIILEKNFYEDLLILPRKQFGSWNEMVLKATEAYKESIVLTKSK